MVTKTRCTGLYSSPAQRTGMPRYVSNPRFTGKNSGIWPRCLHDGDAAQASQRVVSNHSHTVFVPTTSQHATHHFPNIPVA